jgi:hypothetical protein
MFFFVLIKNSAGGREDCIFLRECFSGYPGYYPFFLRIGRIGNRITAVCDG